MVFRDRNEAGKLLAIRLRSYQNKKDALVLAVPRGGVVVGKELSSFLNLPLGIIITQKISAPGNPELAIGALGPDNVVVWNEDVLAQIGLTPEDLAPQIKNEKLKMQNYNEKFKKREISLAGKIIILTDDGIATGATMEAAIAWIKLQNPSKIVLAVPVAPPEVIEKLKPMVEELVCLEQPEFFSAVGQFYQEFEQVTDEEVISILNIK
jgi:predicted phosphoribosyltransferase